MEFDATVMRAALESVQMFKKAHVMFIPMPVMDSQDLLKLLKESGERLEKLAVEAEKEQQEPNIP